MLKVFNCHARIGFGGDMVTCATQNALAQQRYAGFIIHYKN
jgi:hypothetical protein